MPRSAPRPSRPRRRPLFEALESRALLSADLAPAVIDAGSLSMPAAFEVVEPRKEMVFVDGSIRDWESLAAGVGSTRRAIDVVVLDPARDGVEQITAVLAARSGVDAVHLLSHGAAGALLLGNTLVDADSLAARAPVFERWAAALAPDADILLYGCVAGAGDEGPRLLESMAALTGADVAASDDLTGHASFGADWDLERRTGAIETASLLDARQQEGWQDVLATLTVTTTSDVVDGNTTSIAALLASKGADGRISLREAVIAANNTAGADQIILPAGLYALSRTGALEDAASTGDLDITGSLTITGAGSSSTIIDGVASDRLLEISNGSTVTLSGVALQNGRVGVSEPGSAIYIRATNPASANTVRLTDVVVQDNTGGSGAIYIARSSLNMVGSTIQRNSADQLAGGLYNDGGDVVLDRVTVSDNRAQRDGGGIYSGGPSGATLSVSNTTISGNRADAGRGGAIVTNRAISIVNSTIADNSAATTGGIHVEGSGSASLRNTILAFNAGGNANAALTSLGNNLDTGNTAGFAGPGDRINTDPLLGAFDFHGGTTRTYSLQAGSPAINAGTATGAPSTDQRGQSRVGAPDMGAFEYTLVSHEPFAYAPGPLDGANGGTGWSGGWSSVGNDTVVVAGGLTYAGLSVTGGAVQLSAPLFSSVTQTRPLSTTLGTSGTTAWFSFLVRPDVTGLLYHAGIEFGSPGVFVGYKHGAYRIENAGGGSAVGTGVPAISGQTALVVVKAEFLAGNDRLSVYLNPTPGLGAPSAGPAAVKTDRNLGTFSQLAIVGGLGLNDALMDEIRVGFSYADVVPGAVAANQPPVVATPLPDRSAAEDAAFSFQFAANAFSDPNAGDTLSYTAAGLPAWLSFNGSTRTFSGTPRNADVGTTTITVRARDNAGAFVEDQFSLTVTNVNDAPTLGNASLAAVAEDTLAPTGDSLASLFAGQFADVDPGASLAGIAVIANTANTSTQGAWQYSTNGGANWFAIDSVSDGASALALDATTLVRFLPAASFNGTPPALSVRALDNTYTGSFSSTAGTEIRATVNTSTRGGTTAIAAASATVSTSITAVNDPPTVANPIADRSATEDAAFSFQFATSVFADVDAGDTLSYTAAGLPAWLSLNGSTRTFSGTPRNADVGTSTITVRARDNAGAFVEDQFELTVTNVNDQPMVANPIAAQTATEDASFSFQFAADVFADVDVGDTLTYTTPGLPAWLAFDPGTRTFSGLPANIHVGTTAITVRATDGAGAFVDARFDLAVLDTNDAPTVANPIADQSAVGGAAFRFQFPANAFADMDRADALSYTASGLPAWLGFDAATRTFSGTPTTADAGVTAITVRATDGSGSRIEQQFTLTVLATAVPAIPPSAPGSPTPLLPVDTTSPPSPVASPATTENPGGTAGGGTAQPAQAVSTGSKPGYQPSVLMMPVPRTPPPAPSVPQPGADAPPAAPAQLPDARDVQASAPERPAPAVQPPALRDLSIGLSTTAPSAATSTGTIPAADAEALAAFRQIVGSDAWQDSLDQLQDDAQRETKVARIVAGSSTAAVGTLSAGYVLWLLRGGVLMASLMSSLPAWRLIDPLPVLARRGREEADGDEAVDPLERLFDRARASLRRTSRRGRPAAASAGDVTTREGTP